MQKMSLTTKGLTILNFGQAFFMQYFIPNHKKKQDFSCLIQIYSLIPTELYVLVHRCQCSVLLYEKCRAESDVRVSVASGDVITVTNRVTTRRVAAVEATDHEAYSSCLIDRKLFLQSIPINFQPYHICCIF